MQFLIFWFFEGAQGCARVPREPRGAEGCARVPRGPDEASPRGWGGPVLRGSIDALER